MDLLRLRVSRLEVESDIPVKLSHRPPKDDKMATCDGCGAWVSRHYRRVYEVDGELDGCRECGGPSGDEGMV